MKKEPRIKMIHRVGKCLNVWLQKNTRKLKTRQWIIILMAFLSLSGGYCFYLLIQGFNPKNEIFLNIRSIQIPGFMTEKRSLIEIPDYLNDSLITNQKPDKPQKDK